MSKKNKKPHAIVTMGSSGAGKSFSLSKYNNYQHYLVIDYDEMMLQVPELIYNQQHEIYDSSLYRRYYKPISDFTEKLFQAIINGPKINLICHSVIPSMDRIRALCKAGYHVSVLYKTDSPGYLERRVERLKRTHLYTKPEPVSKADVEKFRADLSALDCKDTIKISNMDEWVRLKNMNDQ